MPQQPPEASTPGLTDEELLAALPDLRRYAASLCRSCGPDVEDLVSDTVAQALRKRALYQPGSNPTAWLMTMLHNMHVNRIRRANRRPEVAFNLAEIMAFAPEDAETTRFVREIVAQITKLSPEKRDAIIACVNGEAYEAAAKRLGIELGTFRSRSWRAREELRKFADS
jgi:RNA polymerase sigma-70 factor (ECF subfamily)